MKDDNIITSTDNAAIKNIGKLLKSAKQRRTTKSFVIEGLRIVTDCPPDRILEAYTTPEFYDKHKDSLSSINVKLISDKVMKHISDTVTPQGILAVVKMNDYTISDIIDTETTPAVLILENLQDPGNLGTIIRMAEGANITGIIMSKDTVDVYNPKVARSTMGSIFRVPFVYVEDLMQTVSELKSLKITTYAGHLDGKNVYESDFTTPTGIMIGNEGNGLTEELASLADYKVKIPMYGNVESLNAGIAATVISYEILRQRL